MQSYELCNHVNYLWICWIHFVSFHFSQWNFLYIIDNSTDQFVTKRVFSFILIGTFY